METTAHIDFIAAAYAAATIVIGALIVWVTLDCRAQTRKLADLELQGMTRRSEMVSDRPASRAAETAREQAEEQA
ncbi:MAG TPA: heme exporter protein CcmD [Xanthobacteraceae bacterium]|jgi:heme exporter protein CcmD|nr:heme exporter protein CcmD [Xanthobacteraceae bacterium]